jgi:hypothetical protein
MNVYYEDKIMNLKKIISSCAIIGVSLLGVNAANAACTIRGTVVQVATNGTGTNVYVSTTPAGAAVIPFVYYFSTTSPMITSVLAGSIGKAIYVTGNAGSCPTTGAYRKGGIISLPGIYVK